MICKSNIGSSTLWYADLKKKKCKIFQPSQLQQYLMLGQYNDLYTFNKITNSKKKKQINYSSHDFNIVTMSLNVVAFSGGVTYRK